MPTYPTSKENEFSLLKKIAANSGEIAAGSGGGGGIGAVDSVNGQTGDVVLDNTDVGAPSDSDFSAIEAEVNELIADVAALIGSVGGGGETNPSGNVLLTGPTIAHTEDLTVTVGAATYIIQGQEYASEQTELTAAVADGSNPRIDAIVLNTTPNGSFTGSAAIITGTPAASPVKPAVDPLTQIEVSLITVASAQTVIEVNVEDVYREGTAGWTDTQSGGHITLQDASDPNTGTNAIKGTAVVSGDYFQFEDSASFDLETYDNLVLFVKPTTWANAKQLNITARLAGTARGNTVVLKNGVYGLNTGSNTYQQIVIPTAAFGLSGLLIDQLRFTCAGGGASMTFLVDDVTLQGGLSQSTDSSRMRYSFGGWLTDKFYNKNDTLKYQDSQYVAKRTNNGRNPTTSTDDWERSSGKGIQHFSISFNPKSVCDGTIDRLFLMKVGPDLPNGMVITRWDCSFDADPTTEVDLDFKRADAYIGVANSAVMDVCDTTAGVSSETVAANINGGATVANGKVLYLEFGTAYSADNLQIIFEFWFYAA